MQYQASTFLRISSAFLLSVKRDKIFKPHSIAVPGP
jgi:hypothetical protein